MNILELHNEIRRRETELAELRFQLELVVSVIEYTEKKNRVGRAGLESSDCSAVTSKQTNNNQG